MRPRVLPALLIAPLLVSCDPGRSQAEPFDDASERASMGELERQEHLWRERIDATPDGIDAARQAARYARALARRESKPEALEHAKDYLTRAASLELPEACDAAVDLVHLLSRDALDPQAARRQADGIRARWPASRECVGEAERMLEALAGAPPVSSPTSSPTVLRELAVHGREGGARLVLTSSARIEHELLPQHDLRGTGASFRFPQTMLEATTREATLEQGPLRRASLEPQAGDVVLALELAPGARFRAFALPSPDRFIVDVLPERDRAFDATEPLIVIDPGHGGNDYGARAFGLREADLVLDLGKRVRDVLRRVRPELRVVLTRESNSFVSLEQRVAIANAIAADAFVSIHLNAADEPVEHGGVATFVLDVTDDRQATRLAARENGTSPAEVGALARVLASLIRRDQVASSTALAESVQEATLGAARSVLPRAFNRGVRSAMFHVLVGATMPAILVEASFMTREEEAEALRTERYRDLVARGIAEGVLAWLGAHHEG